MYYCYFNLKHLSPQSQILKSGCTIKNSLNFAQKGGKIFEVAFILLPFKKLMSAEFFEELGGCDER